MNRDKNQLNGLSIVRVNREDLLEAVKANRENHRATFEEAMDGYKKRSIELLEDHIKRIKANAPERVMVSLPFPEDHTEDYDRVIAQLQWSLDDELYLTETEFDTYVRDNWGWSAIVASTNALYTS